MVQSNTDTAVDIRAVQESDELRQALALMVRCFQDQYSEQIHWLQSHATTYPRFLPEHIRVAIRGGRVIAALRVTSETLLIGESRLKVGGIGWLCVNPEYRSQGVARELLQEALHYLHEHGFHASIAFGELDRFENVGYSPTFEECRFRFALQDKRHNGVDGYRVRSIKPGDLGNVHRIHRYAHRMVSCGLLREHAHLSNKWSLLKTAKVVTNADGLVEAYFIPSQCGASAHISELGARSDALNSVLMDACIDFAHRGLHHDLLISLPHQHSFSHYLAQAHPHVHNRVTQRPSGALIILDHAETLESMMPEWEGRVSESLVRELDDELTLIVDGNSYRVRMHYGAVDIARQSGRNKFSMSSQEFVQLLTGYCPVVGVYQRTPRLLSAEGRAMLQTLFPMRYPSITELDRW